MFWYNLLEKNVEKFSFDTTYDVLQVFSREPQRRLHSLVQI